LKDVFLRELVSNASDALEKLRFAKVRGQPILDPDRELEIRIDTETRDGRKLLVVSDTGIGMTEDELRTNIGTIAHSGASAFLKSIDSSDAATVSLIGRFGVGFYSVFMVADRVVIRSRSASPEAAAVEWTSEGAGTYTIDSAPADATRGTRIEVTLKTSEERFAEASTIRAAIRKYSNFVPFPIRVGGDVVNRTTALWREPPNQVKDEQYSEFYRFISHDADDPVTRIHVSVDAPIQFSALLFVPRTNLEMLGFGEGKVSVQLYVKRVLIDAENENLLPKYLRFVRGVVESEDLPLNVSRETLQENTLVFKIRDTLTRKVLDALAELARKDAEEYAGFYRGFGRLLKEGYSDHPNRERFQELLRFNASASSDEKALLSLAEYVALMPAAQKAIYYLSGPSREALARDPRLELFRKKGIPVLYLYDVADEFVLGTLGKYKDHELVSAEGAKASDLAGVGAEDAAAAEPAPEGAPAEADIDGLLARFSSILGKRIRKVVRSERLVDSPVCLVSDDDRVSSHMDKVMRLLHKDAELPQRTLEVNPRHRLIASLARLHAADREDPFVAQACEQLFESYMLLDGYLSDPHRLVARVNDVLAEAAALKASAGSR
jgi:molecular chaperone HtpG